MFGIDLGLTVSSVTLIGMKNHLIDHFIVFGNTRNKDYWKRIMDMAEGLTDAVLGLMRSHTEIMIEPLVAIEIPVFPWRTKNPQAYANTQALYAILRFKLENRAFEVYDIHPMSAKSIARKQFRGTPMSKYRQGKNLNKLGMIRAFFKIHGREPDYSTKVGRETLADSFFIAKAGIAKRKVILSG